MSESSPTTTNNQRLMRPSEIKKPIVMVENIMEVLENTFLSPFHDELDAAKFYNISGQPVDDFIKGSLLSLEKAGKQSMSEYIERLNTETHSEKTMTGKLSIIRKTLQHLIYHLKLNGTGRLPKFDCREIDLVNLLNLLMETMHR